MFRQNSRVLAVLEDIRVFRDGDKLILENRFVRRELELSSGAPRTVSLKTRNGRELAAPKNPACDLAFIGMHEPGKSEVPWKLNTIFCRKKRNPLRLEVTLGMEEPLSRSFYGKTYILYPHLGALGMECSLRTLVTPNFFWNHRRKIRQQKNLESVGDSLCLASEFQPRVCVEFRGRSDVEILPVLEHPANGTEYTGNLLYCDDGKGVGFAYLQEAPPSMEKRDYEMYDFRFAPEDRVLRSCTWGIAPEDLQNSSRTCRSFRHVLLIYETEAEKKQCVKQYLARRYDVSAFHSITVNPWGCGRFPALVSPEFLARECAAAAEIGATHYQFDDGWQQGKALSQMTVWNRYMTPDFWELRENIKQDFPGLIRLCKGKGIKPALWFAPSANAEYRDFRTTAERMLALHREYGICCFKIDAVKLRTYEAEKNFRALLLLLRKKSGGKIFFNLDVTAGQRFGFFQFLDSSLLFLENRYLFKANCTTAYHPEKTLHSLWLLAKYTRLQTLQIEIPYPGDYLAHAPEDAPPPEPESFRYPLEYWAAVALFANPLLWFAPSLVPQKTREVYKKMMALHKRLREHLFAGEIDPVGEEPSGKSITGFCAAAGYALFFRELRAEHDTAYIQEGIGARWKLLAGNGAWENGVLKMPEPTSFALFEKVSQTEI